MQNGCFKKGELLRMGFTKLCDPKEGQTVKFINNFRESNKRIKRTPYPIPKMQDMLLKLEGFQCATSLDLNVGHCHVQLHPDSKKLCTLVFP